MNGGRGYFSLIKCVDIDLIDDTGYIISTKKYPVKTDGNIEYIEIILGGELIKYDINKKEIL